MRSKRDLIHAALISGLLVLGILAVYSYAIRLDFITYDDPDYVTSNAHVRAGLRWDSVQWAFAHTCSAEWHPLTMLSHMADCQLYGLDPRGHHFTNLLFHLGNSLILLFLLWSATGAVWPSAFVAALFAFHPANVEAVAWISERKGLLSTFFGFLCLWSYVRYVKTFKKPGASPATSSGLGTNAIVATPATALYYSLALVFFCLGLLSKPMLITWPGVMLLLDYWPLGRFSSSSPKDRSSASVRLALEKLPFFALALASALVAFLVGREWGAMTTAAETPFSARLSNSVLAYVLYIKNLIWPAGLSINYPFISHWPASQVLAAVIVLGAITLVAISQLPRRPYLAVGWAWYLGTLVPVIGLLHFGNHFMADRYSYVTAIGLFIMLSWAGAELGSKTVPGRAALLVCAGTILTACALCSGTQLRVWRNSETLFLRALAVNENDFVAAENLGFYYGQHMDTAKAEQCYRNALAINPGSTFALEKLASLLIAKDRNEEAAVACQTALALDPRMPDAHCTLGLALMKLGKRQDALDQYVEAIRIRPDFAPAHYNMANALAGQGQFQQAVEHYRESVRWDPDSPDAHNNLAYLLVREGKLAEAVTEFRAALKLKADMWQADYGLADALGRQGNIPEAIEYYRAALQARRDFPEALTRLAWILATNPDSHLRNGSEAASLAERACKLTAYKQPSSLQSLAAAYAELGRFTEAIQCAEKAQSLAGTAGQKELSQKIQETMEAFRSRQPYREPAAVARRSP